MPQDFRQTLTALNAERPFASWVAMGFGAMAVAAWMIWAVEARLPVTVPAAEVTREADVLIARFNDATMAAPEVVLVVVGQTDHLAPVLSTRRDQDALVLRVAFAAVPGTPLPQVRMQLAAQSPAQMLWASLGMGP